MRTPSTGLCLSGLQSKNLGAYAIVSMKSLSIYNSLVKKYLQFSFHVINLFVTISTLSTRELY